MARSSGVGPVYRLSILSSFPVCCFPSSTRGCLVSRRIPLGQTASPNSGQYGMAASHHLKALVRDGTNSVSRGCRRQAHHKQISFSVVLHTLSCIHRRIHTNTHPTTTSNAAVAFPQSCAVPQRRPLSWLFAPKQPFFTHPIIHNPDRLCPPSHAVPSPNV